MRHFDLCVIGSGSGNSIIDEQFADQSVALVDDGPRFGGTCLNVGCIPTKMFVLPADLASSPTEAAKLGVSLTFGGADWSAIRDRIFGRIDPISEAGQAWRERNENVTLFRSRGRFVGPRTFAVDATATAPAETFTATQFVLAAGSRPTLPTVPGLADEHVLARVHTSDTIMRIDELPKRLVILGGGVIAAEFAHVFAAFGVDVTIVTRSTRLLRHEDTTIADRFTELLGRRVTLHLGHQLVSVTTAGEGVRVTSTAPDGTVLNTDADLLLVATGRQPNADTLDLGVAGVDVDHSGRVVVDAAQRTSAPGVFALGDVSNAHQLKHVANREARIVQHNLLHPDELIVDDGRPIPHAVFSDPQVAGVGATQQELELAGVDHVAKVQDYADVAYGWALEDDSHLVKLLADPSTGLLLGAHIVGPQASVLIQPLIQAMSFGLSVREMARGQYWIHPALTEVVENALLGLPLDRSDRMAV